MALLDRRRNLFVNLIVLDSSTFDKGFDRVDLVLDVVAELERGDQAFFDQDGFAGARVAGGASLAGLAGEGAEAANLDRVAFDQLFSQEVQELFDDGLDVVAHKSSGLGDFLNQCLFSYICHALNIGLSKS